MEARALRRLNASRLILICAGVAMVLIGIYRDEMRVVLTKAINICLECIGIG